MGAHGDGLDHGAETTNLSACGVDHGLSIADHGNIGGRAPDVRHQRIVHIGQPARAHDRSRRTTEDGFDGAFTGLLGAHQGSVTPDDHHGGINADVPQGVLCAANQPVDHPNQPRVQNCRHGAFGAVQFRRQLMRASDRRAGHLGNDPRDFEFMRRVAGGELRSDRIARDAVMCRQKRAERVNIQLCRFATRMVVPAGDHQRRIALQRVV